MPITLSINSPQTAKRIENFIRDTLSKAGFTRIVVGLSGGIDSAVSCTLAAQAIGADNIYPVILPYGKLNTESEEDSTLFAESLSIPKNNITQINIEPIVAEFIRINPKPDRIRLGNVMARIRMIILYDLSKKFKAVVLGTENKSEYLLGYFTRFGDEASDIEPIRNLYKTQVRQLAKYLRVPEKIIRKTPTAELYSGQTDEGEFGFSYEAGDQILYLSIEGKLNREKIVKKGYPLELVDRVHKRMEANKFKHRLPYHI